MLAYRLTLAERRSHLHAKVVARRSAENALRFLTESFDAARAAGHTCLLLETHFSGPSLNERNLTQVIAERAARASKMHKIAFVPMATDDPGITYAVEKEAIEQGLNVRVFRDVAAAERWLTANWRFGV